MWNRVSSYWQQPLTIFLFNISPILLSAQLTITYVKVKVKSRSVMSNSLQPHGLYSPEFSRPNTGVGSLSLLQGIFPTQGLNAGLPHCRRILYQLSHKVSPRILEWVTYPFASISSQPRNRNRVSCIAGRFLTNWANIKPKMSLIQSQEVNNVQCKRALLKLPVLGLPVHS